MYCEEATPIDDMAKIICRLAEKWGAFELRYHQGRHMIIFMWDEYDTHSDDGMLFDAEYVKLKLALIHRYKVADCGTYRQDNDDLKRNSELIVRCCTQLRWRNGIQ